MPTITHTDPAYIEAIIRSCDICFVGMVDSNGVPYVTPMNFGYKEGVVYFHSGQEGRKISILEHNPQVCLTFCSERQITCQHPEVACSYSVKSHSVLVSGKVCFVDDYDSKLEALTILMQNYTDVDFTFNRPSIENVKIWKVQIENISCKEFGVSPRRKKQSEAY